MLGDCVEVRMVVGADDHERRHPELRERAQLRPEQLRLLVCGLELERAALLRSHLVTMLRLDPEVEVHLGRRVEIA
jgi:hypothetical protein